MLIDCSYFIKGSRHILNASQGQIGTVSDANAIQVNEAIEYYINEHQLPFLIRMFGQELGPELNSYINKNPNYALIRRVDGVMARGLGENKTRIVENPDSEENPIYDKVLSKICESFADYVFFHILRDSNTQSTITGLVRLKCANEYVAPIRRQVSVWNTMVERNRHFAMWCQSKDCHLKGISISTDMVTKINTLNL